MIVFSASLKEKLVNRVAQDMERFQGKHRDDLALAWDGYSAALLEWGAIDAGTHYRIVEKLPQSDDVPVMSIFLGSEED